MSVARVLALVLLFSDSKHFSKQLCIKEKLKFLKYLKKENYPFFWLLIIIPKKKQYYINKYIINLFNEIKLNIIPSTSNIIIPKLFINKLKSLIIEATVII